MTTIDLNADLGEGMPWDLALLTFVSSANVSCGAHAGDAEVIDATLAEAGRLGVAVGAHPGWADRAGFGRVERSATRVELETIAREQVGWLRSRADRLGVVVRYLKPHGALYNQAMRDGPESEPIRLGLIDAALALRLPLLGLPGTALERMASVRGVSYVAEGFPDRGYGADGRLIPRSQSGALIEGRDDVIAQALALATVGRRVDSLCLHGDHPEAVARAAAIRGALEGRGIAVRPFAR